MGTKQGVLMNRTQPVLKIVMDDETGKVVDIQGYAGNGPEPMQILYPQTGKSKVEMMNLWLEKRRIPQNREGLDVATKVFPDLRKDLTMLSLSDQYWFRFDPDDDWGKINFFTNPYSEEIGRLFFSPWNIKTDELYAPCPDRTTNGVLRKRWTREGEDSYLLKAASKQYKQEPLSEVLASIALSELNILPVVKYDLVVDGMRLCSKCKNFVDQDSEFVPASVIFHSKPKPDGVTNFQHLIDTCQGLGIQKAKYYISQMIVADYLVYNSDRHLGNFGFIRDAVTGEIRRFAPLFDFGSSYWGRSDVVEKKMSRLFTHEEEQHALEVAIKKNTLKQAPMSGRMIKAVDMYPDISEKKKMAIKKKMAEMEKEIERLLRCVHPEKEVHKDISEKKERMPSFVK